MRIAIVGNSGSGKSTLARRLSAGRVPVLDLDTIVWAPGTIAQRRQQEEIVADLDRFCAGQENWIVEGCYGELIKRVLRLGPELIFLNPGEARCLENCRRRPWEPHKYPSPADQDAMLEHLLEWVRAYFTRDDELSLRHHRALFDGYEGPRRELVEPPDALPPPG